MNHSRLLRPGPSLSPPRSEIHSLKEIGKFRVIPVTDLAKYAYGGDREQMVKDIRGLARQSLLRDKTLEISQRRLSEW